MHYRENININDALGDYSLTLVDALDSLAVSMLHVILHMQDFTLLTCPGYGQLQ